MYKILSLVLLGLGSLIMILKSLLHSTLNIAEGISVFIGLTFIVIALSVFLFEYFNDNKENSTNNADNNEEKNIEKSQQKANDFLKSLKNNIRKEIAELKRKSSFNLALGIMTGISGIIVLMYLFITQPTTMTDKSASLLSPYLPLVLLIEVLAFFFFNQYRNQMKDVKYFVNELTNIEQKSSAITLSIEKNNSEDIPEIIKNLINDDRNKSQQAENKDISNTVIEKLIDKIK